jgi:hypothetical protein
MPGAGHSIVLSDPLAEPQADPPAETLADPLAGKRSSAGGAVTMSPQNLSGS